MSSTLQLRLPAPLTAEHVRRLCAGLGEQLRTGAVSDVVCHVDGAGSDLVTVDAVARLALLTRRAGVAFALDSPGEDLALLLGLVGLRGVFAGPPDDP